MTMGALFGALIVVSDNAKVAIIKACLYEPQVNRTYSEIRLCCVPFEKKIVGVTDPRPRDELIDKSAIFPGE